MPLAIEHRDDFVAFDSRLRKERPSDVEEWERMMVAWEGDHKRPNPYVLPKAGMRVLHAICLSF